MNKTKPIHTIKRGSLELAVWENEGKEKRFLRATISRRYRDANGKLQNTSSFSGRNLDDLALLAIQGAAYIAEATQPEAAPAAEEEAA